MEQKQEALAVMRKILGEDPENVNALNYIGYTYAEMGVQLPEAKQLVEKALKLKPNDGYIVDSLAWVYFKMGQQQKALELMHKALTIVPDDPVMLEHLGDIYASLGNRGKAREAYEKALTAKHEEPDKIRGKLRALE
jgi:Flp pilus assembly protein TadD